MVDYVIDVNVACVANGQSEQVSLQCRLACIEKLMQVVQGRQGKVVIDDSFHILGAYKDALNFSGQPGVGDMFFKHVFTNQAQRKRVRTVGITPLEQDPRGYVEFPEDAELVRFDRDDRVYVATVIADELKSIVLNAVDSDWAIFEKPLAKHGITIENLCRTELKAG
jgi:hypothetical protein